MLAFKWMLQAKERGHMWPGMGLIRARPRREHGGGDHGDGGGSIEGGGAVAVVKEGELG